MDLNTWVNKNYEEMYNTVNNITQGHELSDELFSDVVFQLLNKPDKFNEVPDEQKMYYFIRVVKNNWSSSTSPFQYQRQQHKKRHTTFDMGKQREDKEETYTGPTMEWVNKQLQDFDWFERDLFLLWVEQGTLVGVHRETTIPLNSVGTYIRNIKTELNKRWENKINNNELYDL